MRWLLLVVLGAALVGCRDSPDDHGVDVPGRAREALDCPGKPWQQGEGNYDTGPESVQDDADSAVHDFLDNEIAFVPDIEVEELGRQGREVLFAWKEGSTRLGSFVVHDDMTGPGDAHGWGVFDYAYCDPAFWPDEVAAGAGWLVWVNADGDRIPTSIVYSAPGPEHCGWQDTTFLTLGYEGRRGIFLGSPHPDLAGYLATTYAAHVEVPTDAKDTGYQREGRELWTTAEAAYLVTSDGDAQRWPAEKKPIGCA